MLEKTVNKEGQIQIINNAEKVVKIENKFMLVRLIRTQRWDDRFLDENEARFTQPMPRAKFVNPIDDPYYLIRKSDLSNLKASHKKGDKE